MITEEFAAGNSFIHNLDPRCKICIAAVFSIFTAVQSMFFPLAPAFSTAFILVIAARLPGKKVARRVLLVNGFILFLWFFLPFSTPGTTIVSPGPFTITREGLVLSSLITLKANTIILTLLALIATTPAANLGQALQQLKVPSKLCRLFLFSYRYLFVIEQEYHRLRRALKVRNFRIKTNLHTYRSLSYLLGMLFVRSWDRAERVYQAMCCRGFQGQFHSITEYSLHKRDIIFTLSMGIVIMCIGTIGLIL